MTDAHLVPLEGSIHPIPPGAKAVRRTNANRWIDLTLGVKRRADLPDLSALDKVAPSERQYMTRQQMTDRHGSDPAAVDAISKWAAANDLVVTRDEPISARLGLGGTAENLSKAFGVDLFDYEDPELGEFHARTGPVHLPMELSGQITGVFGFNNHRILRRSRRMMTAGGADIAAKARPWFIPTELGQIYDFPAVDASGQTIGLLEFGGGVDSSDVAAYFTKIGATAPNVTVIAVDGVSTDPTSDPDSTGEVMLDVDVAGALGGGAKLAVYFATFDEKGMVDILSKVIADSVNDPSVLSVSWGWAENQAFNNSGVTWSPAAIDHINHSFLAAAQLGISVCVSTGDDGSEAQIKDGRAHVNFPATSPYVLAVGGTTLHAKTSASGVQHVTETVWNDGPGSGTGGGVSDITPKPDWQSGIALTSINPGHFNGRAIPDVAADADPKTGYLTMSGGQLQIVGGTSASAPLWASLISRINASLNARVGNFNALLYTKIGPANVLRDITKGDNDTDGLLNGAYPAGPGWDACSGWGAPDGQKLLTAFR
jgi:kumamolisin